MQPNADPQAIHGQMRRLARQQAALQIRWQTHGWIQIDPPAEPTAGMAANKLNPPTADPQPDPSDTNPLAADPRADPTDVDASKWWGNDEQSEQRDWLRRHGNG